MQENLMIKKPENNQHHGNLKEALVLAGMQILEEEGLAALTLRRCAAMAGVSHAAPAHHFDGLKGLRTAIAIRGYAIFEQMMKDGIDSAGAEPRAQALGMCIGYVKFATKHNALFNLIFDRPDMFIQNDDWKRSGGSARQVLNDISALFEDGPGGPSATEVALFALVHGYSKLIEIGRVVPGSGNGRDVSFEDVMGFMELQVKQN